MKVIPDLESQEFQKAIYRAIGKEGANLDVVVILAVMSNVVGRLIAMQDQTMYTPSQVMKMVGENIEQGNQDVINGLEPTGGMQ